MDPFQENLVKTMAYIKEHKKQVMAALGGIVVVVAVFSGILTSFKHSEDKASDMIANAVNEYEKAQDQKKGYEKVKDDFLAVFQDYSNTSAGRMARVKFAKICFDAGEFDTAFEMYSQAYDIFKKDPGLKNFLLISLGNVCQAKQDFQKARAYFTRVEDSEYLPAKAEALFALATLSEAENDPEASRKLYEKLANEYKGSIYHDIAQAKSVN